MFLVSFGFVALITLKKIVIFQTYTGTAALPFISVFFLKNSELLTGVDPCMFFQIAQLSESFVTNCTYVRLFTLN